jgi:hypothetical protein
MTATTRYLGLNLDGASATSATTTGPCDGPQSIPGADIPPSAIADPDGHLPLAPDGVLSTADLRGTGLSWDSSSCALAELQDRRRPLADAWAHLLGRVPDQIASSATAVTSREKAAQAIAVVTGGSSIVSATAQSDVRAALVIPNGLDEVGQDLLINALAPLGSLDDRLRLVWRPIASGLYWCELHRESFDLVRRPDGVSVGSLLCLHLGIDEFEATRLQLIPTTIESTRLLVPARRRHSDRDPPHLRPGRHVLEDLVEESLPRHLAKDRDAQWRLVWTSPWLRRLLSKGNETSLMDRLRLQLAAKTIPLTDIDLVGESMQQPGIGLDVALSAWLGSTSTFLSRDREPWVGAVVTGPFASLPWRSSTLGSWLASRLTGSHQLKSLVVSPFDSTVEPAAAGAAIFAARADQGWPTYLDTLPQLKLLTIQRGEPEWLDILQDHDAKEGAPRYVPGDREWQRDPDLLGVSLAKDSKDARFDLVMEGHATVREAVARLPAAPKQRERVRLNIRMRPASGFARVRVVPEDPEFKLERAVLLDFHAMTDTKKSPEELRLSLPRGFPDASRRAASPDRWREAQASLSEFVRNAQRKPVAPALVAMLKDIRSVLGKKDNNRRDALGATAISSEGKPPSLIDSAQRLVDDVTNLLIGFLSHRSEDVRRIATVALGYASCSHPVLIESLRNDLTQSGVGLHETAIIAIGNCLREPDHVAEALRRFTIDLNADAAREDRLRAIAQMCRYRSDALEATPSKRCDDLMEVLHRTIESEYGAAIQHWRQTNRTKRLAIIFRESCRSVLFLLRRRRYDESFLSPSRNLAKALKETFSNVADAIKQQKMEFMTGQVNQSDTFNQISLYIDWKGSGVVNFGED